jgi:DNA polymerase II
MEECYKGFILTAHSEDFSGRHQIRYFGQSPQGPFELLFTEEKPLFFVERGQEIPHRAFVKQKEVALKSFSGQAVDSLYFSTQKDLYDYREELRQKGTRTFEGDIRSSERFLMERFIKGSVEFCPGPKGKVLEKGVWKFENPLVRPTEYTPHFKVMSLDIETSMGSDLYSIGIHVTGEGGDIKRVYMVGPDQGAALEGELFYYPSERELWVSFLQDFHIIDPDILIGWHVVGFDLAFLERKCRQWGLSFNLGRKKSRTQLSEKKSGSQIFARMKGRIVVDGPVALRSAFYQFENFKLATVSKALLGTSKDIEAEGSGKVEEITRRFKEDKPSLAKYNLLDCTLVIDIFKKTGILHLMTTRSQLTGLQLDRLGVSTAAFDFHMLPQIHRKGFVAPNVLDIQRDVHAAGGHVIEPVGGLHQHVIILDFKSLYPSIMRTFKIDPYSRLKSETNPVSTPAGVKFSRTEHVLPDFIEKMLFRREQAKQTGDHYLSQAIKILLNSFYGVMGSSGSRFYHADLPSAITGTGQWILRETIEYFQNEGYEVLYGDTDSVFVKLLTHEKNAPFEKGQYLANKAGQHISKSLRKHFDVESFLEVEFEKYYSKIFFLPLRTGEGAAKKKYVGKVKNSEGKENLIFSGMEFVRSDWTLLAKKLQYEIYDHFFRSEDVAERIINLMNELRDGKHDQDLVLRKRMSKPIEEYKKGLPPHVKAAVLLKEAGLDVPRDIEYVMTRRGPIPTALDCDDIDYQHYIDKQIRPIAEVVLQEMGKEFDELISGAQLSLF